MSMTGYFSESRNLDRPAASAAVVRLREAGDRRRNARTGRDGQSGRSTARRFANRAFHLAAAWPNKEH